MKSLFRRRARFLAVAALALAGGLVTGTSTGCARGPNAGEFTATPIYGTGERFSRIGRNIDVELKMLNDDLDRALLLRPVSGLTEWNIP